MKSVVITVISGIIFLIILFFILFTNDNDNNNQLTKIENIAKPPRRTITNRFNYKPRKKSNNYKNQNDKKQSDWRKHIPEWEKQRLEWEKQKLEQKNRELKRNEERLKQEKQRLEEEKQRLKQEEEKQKLEQKLKQEKEKLKQSRKIQKKFKTINELMLKLYDNGLIDRWRLGSGMVYRKYVGKYISRDNILKIMGKENLRNIKGNFVGYCYSPDWGWINVKEMKMERLAKLGFTYEWECLDGLIYIYYEIHKNPLVLRLYKSPDGFYINYIFIITLRKNK